MTTLLTTPAHDAGPVTSPTLISLNYEWNELVPRSAPLVAGWARRFPALSVADDLGDLLALIPSAPDVILGALLRLGAEGESVAWRTVLQAMLGKAVLLSAGSDERFAEAVSELWVAIAEYPVSRRPRSIAANLAWGLRRRLAAGEGLAGPPSVAGREPTAELNAVSTLAQARSLGLLDERGHHTLWLVYVAGLSSARAGAELGISPELVRYRCSRSLRRLAARADLLAA